MQGDTEKDVNSNTLSIGKGTQPLMIAGLTTVTSTPQNSSKSSTNRPPRVDERYKETPKFPQKSPSSNTSKAFEETSSPTHFILPSHLLKMYATTTRGPSPVTLPNIYDDETLVGVLTPSPTPALVPLPPSDTRTVASTRVASPVYMPHTPSPVDYWMPEDKDIQDDMGTAAEHAAFMAARQFSFGLSWSGAIQLSRRANPRGPPALLVRTIVITLSRSMIFNPLTGQVVIQTREQPEQPAPLPALTQQQLQWLEEDLRAETPVPTLPSYHSRAMTEAMDDESIPALALVLEDEDHEEAETPAPGGPMPGVHPGFGWFCNANEETGSPIFREYIVNDGLKIIAPYYQLDMDTDSPKLLLTHGRRCTIHSRTL
jgi:hypothetical protein